MTTSVNAAACNTTVIATLLASDDVTTCSTDSGYSFTSLTTPTDAEMSAMCGDEACLSALAALEALNLGDCTAGTFAIMSGLVDPIQSACGSSSASSSSSPTATTATPSTTAPSTTSSSSSASASASATSSASRGSSTSSSGGGSSTASSSGGSRTPSSDGVTGGTSASSSDSGGGHAIVIGVVCTGAALVLIAVAVAVYCLRKRRADASHSEEGSETNVNLQVAVLKLASGEANDTESSHFAPLKTPAGADKLQSTNLWDDPVIVASRVPLSSIKFRGCISQGGYGEVHRAVYRKQLVAVKVLLFANRKDMTHINAFLSEIKLAATLDHPSIVTFIGVAWEALSDLCSVAEFMEGGDLRTLLTEYKRDGHPVGLNATKLRIAMQVAHALTYMHSLTPMVLHRDLKSRNILLTAQLEAKLTDFGASKERLDKTLTAGVGTLLWMAPEVVMGEKYDEKADIFSFGVVLSELDTHELPYDSARHRTSDGGLLPDVAMMQLVLLGRLRVDLSSGLSINVRRLAESCVSIDPKVRPTAAQAAYELSKALKSVGL